MEISLDICEFSGRKINDPWKYCSMFKSKEVICGCNWNNSMCPTYKLYKEGKIDVQL